MPAINEENISSRGELSGGIFFVASLKDPDIKVKFEFRYSKITSYNYNEFLIRLNIHGTYIKW